jgi:hypothetical protein
MLRKPKGQLRMDNPETQETLDRRHRKKTNNTETNTTPKTKKINNTDPTKSGVIPSTREGQLFMFLTKQTNNKSLVHINFIFS